jgi:enoyl-CoA hydratase/carnithine racemase
MRIGFVDRVVPAADLVSGACAYIEDLAANVSPRSVAVMKSMVYDGLSQDVLTALREADRQTMRALRHPDAKEGAASFIERRGPRFAPLGAGD